MSSTSDQELRTTGRPTRAVKKDVSYNENCCDEDGEKNDKFPKPRPIKKMDSVLTKAAKLITMFLHASYLVQKEDRLVVRACKIKGCDCSTDSCPNVEKKWECPKNCKRGNCKNQNFRKNVCANLIVAAAGDRGRGVYAGEELKKGRFLCPYYGDLISPAEREQRKEQYKDEGLAHDYTFKAGNFFIDPTKNGNIAKYANHSCEPNMVAITYKLNGHHKNLMVIGYFAARNIGYGEELTVGYNFDYDPENAQACLCGATSCNGFMGKGPKKEDMVVEIPVEVSSKKTGANKKTRANKTTRANKMTGAVKKTGARKKTGVIGRVGKSRNVFKKQQVQKQPIQARVEALENDENNFDAPRNDENVQIDAQMVDQWDLAEEIRGQIAILGSERSTRSFTKDIIKLTQ